MTDQSQKSAGTGSSNQQIHSRRPGLIYPLISWGTGILVVAVLAWLNYPMLDQIAQNATYTPIPTTPANTSTPRPTRTATITPTPTTVPTITPTPFPPSAYEVQDSTQLDPIVPGLEGKSIVLNEDTAAEVNPPFNDPQWIPSSQIAQQLGKDFSEPFYATFGAGSIRWKMDKALAPGLYQIYILDTVYSSAGSLDFHVSLGTQELNPIIGSHSVDFKSSRGEVPQISDEWRSIGIYNLDRSDILSIATSWQARDQDSIVAVDRILIAPLSPADGTLLGMLPKTTNIVLVDDLAADIKSSQPLFPELSVPAWNGAFQYAVNTDREIQATWTPPDQLPIGQYEIFAYIPQIHNSGSANYSVFVNDKPLDPDGGKSPITVNQSQYAGGQWVSLGTYTTPHEYEKPVSFKVQMIVAAGTKGEISIDGIAFVKK